MIHRGRVAVDKNEVFPCEIVDERSRRIDGKRGACNDEQVRLGDTAQTFRYGSVIQCFLIQYDIRFDNAAAGAAGNAFSSQYILGRIAFMAFKTIIAVDAAVQLQNLFAAGHLVQAVNILGHNGHQLARGLQLRQLAVRRIGAGGQTKHFLPVKIKKLRRVTDKKTVAEDGLRGIGVLLMVQAVYGTKIRDSAFGGDAGPAEKNDTARIIYQLLQFIGLIGHGISLLL